MSVRLYAKSITVTLSILGIASALLSCLVPVHGDTQQVIGIEPQIIYVQRKNSVVRTIGYKLPNSGVGAYYAQLEPYEQPEIVNPCDIDFTEAEATKHYEDNLNYRITTAQFAKKRAIHMYDQHGNLVKFLREELK
jgi:hypothetical protein